MISCSTMGFTASPSIVTNSTGNITKSSECLIGMWGGGGAGGGSPGELGNNYDMPGGGGGGGGCYALIAITNSSWLDGMATYTVSPGAGGQPTFSSPYNGNPGGPTSLTLTSSAGQQVQFIVSGGDGGSSVNSVNYAAGGNGGQGFIVQPSSPDFLVCQLTSFGGGGGVGLTSKTSITGGAGGKGYNNGLQDTSGYDGNPGIGNNGQVGSGSTRAGYGGGFYGSLGGNCTNTTDSYFYNGAGSGGSTGNDTPTTNPPMLGGPHATRSGPGAGAGWHAPLSHYNSTVGALGGGGGGGGIGSLVFVSGVAPSAGGSGKVQFYYMF